MTKELDTLEMTHVEKISLPKQVKDWMLEQIHRITDNVQVYNIDANLSLSLYESDGTGEWVEKNLGDLPAQKGMWISLVPLSNIMPWQKRPAGESVLVVRGKTAKLPDKMHPFMISNLSNQPLQMGFYEHWKGFSYMDEGKQMWNSSLNKGSVITLGLWRYTDMTDGLFDYHFEFWMNDVQKFF